jgi:hypothetical protein
MCRSFRPLLILDPYPALTRRAMKCRRFAPLIYVDPEGLSHLAPGGLLGHARRAGA